MLVSIWCTSSSKGPDGLIARNEQMEVFGLLSCSAASEAGLKVSDELSVLLSLSCCKAKQLLASIRCTSSSKGPDGCSTGTTANGGFWVVQLLCCLSSRAEGVRWVECVAVTQLVQSKAAAGVH